MNIDKIFCINLDRRPDRWQQCLLEFARLGIRDFERFPGCDHKIGNAGCTRSHRLLLRRIAEGSWSQVLVLEDDFKALSVNFWEEFQTLAVFVPDFDILYVGGHYGSKPLARVNEHVVKIDTMLTTSSYVITRSFAGILADKFDADEKLLAPSLEGYLGPIDFIFSKYLRDYRAYILQPRLMVQRPGLSDLTGKEENYEMCMLDTRHERMV